MRTYLIDTNIILRFLLNDVPSQCLKIKTKLKDAKSGKLRLVITDIIFFESYFTLTSYYKYSKENVLEVLESLISSGYFEVENRDILLESLKIYKLSNLSFVDSYLAARSGPDMADIFTFDKKLQKYAENS